MEQTGINRSTPAQEVRATRGAKAGAADASAAPADGFALLLASLGEEGEGLALDAAPWSASAQDDAAAQAALPGQSLQQPDGMTMAALLAGLQPGGAPLPQDAGAQALQTKPLQLAPGAAAALSEQIGLGLQRPGHDTLVGETALLDGAADTPVLPGPAVGLRAALARSARAGVAADIDGGQTTRTGAVARAAAAQAGATVPVGQTPPAPQAPAAQAQPVAAPGRREALQQDLMALGRSLGDGPAPAGAGGLQAAAAAAGGSGVGGRAGSDGVQGPGGGGAEAPRDTAELAAPAPADGAQQPGAGDAQDQLAERVAYWVHQQTQSAALTLDHEGQAVQVQVSLTGDQAHIAFTSDEAQARQALDAGTAELRALLQEQGLQLAGVTVGAGGSGNGRQPGGEPRDERGGARQGTARVQAANGSAGVPRSQGAARSQRSVDIFV
ncbi:flagellar hook-length control protein FliK [Pulveribacter suum]|uniref:Flagellar hook-length control protein FliK n=1 Tax=Pulveribacter suum TaxID=2116657 RepID=A0A2P1NIQ4_9BURK|nr:flagellar hook-length control protein FliK [Pulveribacter suum]AVP56870.1 flagellar hook-length control protein FliK [Pulveribacter suum]